MCFRGSILGLISMFTKELAKRRWLCTAEFRLRVPHIATSMMATPPPPTTNKNLLECNRRVTEWWFSLFDSLGPKWTNSISICVRVCRHKSRSQIEIHPKTTADRTRFASSIRNAARRDATPERVNDAAPLKAIVVVQQLHANRIHKIYVT